MHADDADALGIGRERGESLRLGGQLPLALGEGKPLRCDVERGDAVTRGSWRAWRTRAL